MTWMQPDRWIAIGRGRYVIVPYGETVEVNDDRTLTMTAGCWLWFSYFGTTRQDAEALEAELRHPILVDYFRGCAPLDLPQSGTVVRLPDQQLSIGM